MYYICCSALNFFNLEFKENIFILRSLKYVCGYGVFCVEFNFPANNCVLVLVPNKLTNILGKLLVNYKASVSWL